MVVVAVDVMTNVDPCCSAHAHFHAVAARRQDVEVRANVAEGGKLETSLLFIGFILGLQTDITTFDV